ncbi:hypothetical protein [Metaclostridioides mangenotii]|uniref:hypothetical protein n=1 Tax=Metaclostridioides mangenotii TaxID=1540 RepID=UPI0004677D91|nr:hypothetical protein [Clostridioides mangenotii]
MESELINLREFKGIIDEEIHKGKVDEIVSKFTFDEQEVKPLKDKVINREISISDFEKELYALQGIKYIESKNNKENFSTDNSNDISIEIMDQKETKRTPYGGILE